MKNHLKVCAMLVLLIGLGVAAHADTLSAAAEVAGSAAKTTKKDLAATQKKRQAEVAMAKDASFLEGHKRAMIARWDHIPNTTSQGDLCTRKQVPELRQLKDENILSYYQTFIFPENESLGNKLRLVEVKVDPKHRRQYTLTLYMVAQNYWHNMEILTVTRQVNALTGEVQETMEE